MEQYGASNLLWISRTWYTLIILIFAFYLCGFAIMGSFVNFPAKTLSSKWPCEANVLVKMLGLETFKPYCTVPNYKSMYVPNTSMALFRLYRRQKSKPNELNDDTLIQKRMVGYAESDIFPRFWKAAFKCLNWIANDDSSEGFRRGPNDVRKMYNAKYFNSV